MKTTKLSLASLTLIAALAATGCGGGGGYQSSGPMQPPVPPTVPPTQSFTGWSKTTVFALAEDQTPAVVDTLTFNFDGDEDPNAYADLLPAT